MILEYLFFDKTQRKNVESFNHELETSYDNNENLPFQITYRDFENLECWTIRYERSENGEAAAKQISKISSRICQKFSPTILTDESSEYFNKTLYPLVNKFERLLRKFLYLKVSQCDEEKFRSVITDIDQKDFGDIYTILFVDSNFRADAKDRIKKLNTQAEMIQAINALQENTAWHILVGDTALSIIKDNFSLLKEYRNDVMHAHNIKWEKYKKAKELFTDANIELENELNRLLQSPSMLPMSVKTISTLYEKMMSFSISTEKVLSSLAPAVEKVAKIADASVPTEVQANLMKILQGLGLDASSISDSQAADNSISKTEET